MPHDIEALVEFASKVIGNEFRNRLAQASDPDEVKEIAETWEKALAGLTEIEEAFAT